MNMSEVFNISEFNDDPFREPDLEKPVHEEAIISAIWYLYYFMMFTETIKLFLSVFLLVADSYLISTIYKDKKKTKTKKYIMHFAICHIFLFVSSPLFYILVDLMNIMRHVGYEFYYCIMAIEQLSVILGLFLAFGLGLEWLVLVYNPKLTSTLKLIYENFLTVLYALSLGQFLVQFISSIFSQTWLISHFISRIVLFMVSLFLMWCNYLKYRNRIVLQARNGYALTIANIIVFSWIPLYLFDILLHFTTNYKITHAIFLSLWFIPEWLAFGNTFIIIIVLARLDIYFQSYYEKVFKKSVKRRDDEENLSESVDENSVKNNVTAYENVYV